MDVICSDAVLPENTPVSGVLVMTAQRSWSPPGRANSALVLPVLVHPQSCSVIHRRAGRRVFRRRARLVLGGSPTIVGYYEDH